MLKKKPLSELWESCAEIIFLHPIAFLHCYHHAATAIFTLMGMKSATPVSWVVASLNLAVHIIMYWYYFQSARGIRVWWKEWITRLQILQFIIDLGTCQSLLSYCNWLTRHLGFVVFVSYSYYTALYLPWMPRVGSCVADSQIAIAAFTILTSYLVLFTLFYKATYKTNGKSYMRYKSLEQKKKVTLPLCTIID